MSEAVVVNAGAAQHEVQLYESPSRLGAQVAESLRVALTAGGSAIAIARPQHLSEIERCLSDHGIDCDALRSTGRLHLVDAELTVSALFVDGRIDRALFDAAIGTLVRQLIAQGGPVRAYGEMVDVLWAAGDARAMLDLEALWNALLTGTSVHLLCGYRVGAFERDSATFDEVLAAHDGAHPTAGRAKENLDAASALAKLEQRAVALQSEIDRRQRLELLMTHLLDITAELAQAQTREDIAHVMIDRAAVPVGASAIGVWMRGPEGGQLELLDTSASQRGVAKQYQRIPLDGDTPLAASVRGAESVYLSTHADYEARFPDSWRRVAAFRSALHGAFAIVPCIAGSATLGALCFTYSTERTFDDAEKSYKTLLARHCALALTRVQLLEQERSQREAALHAAAAEKQARGDVELLYELIASFNRIDEIGAVYDLALEFVQRISRSDRAAILLFDNAGVMRFRASAGLSDTYRAAVEGHSPWKPDDSFPAPIVVADAETDPAWAEYRPVFAAEGIRALAFVPIVHRRKLIGKFMLYRNDPRTFAPRDLQLTATVAVHVGQAVERKQQERELARAYREERDARSLAEESARAREEILSVVSHDLRNPLGTIMMAASTLLNVTAAGEIKNQDRIRVTADRIQRQAERMARLIEDLVDFAGIQAGRLLLQRSKHAPHDILTTTRDIFGPIASERGLRLETEVLLNLPTIECDSNRAVQVLSNLVSNALKVTPKGGQIAIGAAVMRHADGSQPPVAGEIVFYVRDTGPGIEPDEMPNLFERYWRGKQSAYRGTGLGLSIARGIVDAHGGRIWAESRPGAGSTFYFSLSPDPQAAAPSS